MAAKITNKGGIWIMQTRLIGIVLIVGLIATLLCSCTPLGATPSYPPASIAASTATASSITSAESQTPAVTDAPLPYQDASLPVEARVKDLLGRMTLDEKAGQMIQAERGSASPAAVTKAALGSVLSGGGSTPGDGGPEAWLDMTQAYQQAAMKCRLPIPLLYGVDAVHGHNNAVEAVLFPHNIALGAANSPELMKQMGVAVAEEMIATGIPWTFAPCLAVAQDPRWGRTYESFSSDPALVTSLALPYADGLLAGGAIPTAKHYVADGGAIWGTSKAIGYHIDQGDAAIDEQTLRHTHLAPYLAMIKAGVPVVMVSFSSWNGVKLHEQKYLLTDVLKGELGFQGFVISDYNGIEQLAYGTLAEKVAAAVNAGVDMLMETGLYAMALKAIVSGVNNGMIPQARVDDAVSRILRVKFEMGLFEDPFLQKRKAGGFGTDEHKVLAAELVARSLVLLKNDGILPFKAGQKVFVTGPAADDLGAQCGGWSLSWQGWTSDNRKTGGTTILAGLKLAAARAGAEILTDSADLEKADVVLLIIGEKPYAEGVGDSPDMSLTGKLALDGNVPALELAKSSEKPVVALVVAGREMVISDELKSWNAAVMAWLPGTEGQGVAPALFGERGFTGKLPMPWYRTVEDIGKQEAEPLFPIGYGLEQK